MKKRKSIRLKGYNYSQNGAYFITICVQHRECRLGEIINNEMKLNDAGKMIQLIWNQIPIYYSDIEIDAFQIMPNHVHGIVIIEPGQPRGSGQPRGVAPTLSLSDIVHRFKTLTTKKYIDGIKENDWPCFNKRLWQRNYYEHIIRNEESLSKIREYIIHNPLNWEQDKLNPIN